MKSITRKTLLYQSGVEYADFCINHVEGCSHGCKYPCYAFLMKKRCGVVKSYAEWCEPKIVANALELLDKEIPRYRNKIKYVHLCFTTDPFMYNYESICDLSLKIIDKLNGNGIRCTTLTKGTYPKETAARNGQSMNNEYGITLVSLSEVFRKSFEPYSAPIKKRIKSLQYLNAQGFKTWVSIEPYPPPDLIRQDLLKILNAISFVNKIVFGKLNYNPASSRPEHVKQFYNNSAEMVVNFCNAKKIDYHIKDGTVR